MRAALYIRVSTDEQAQEGFSIDAQKTHLVKKCAEWGYDVADFYVDDGYSAKDMKRPALRQLMKDVQARSIDVVVFWRLDRFTRTSRDFHKIDEILSKHNAGIRSVTEPIDTTSAIGRFQLQLSVLLGQLERETTAERVHFVMEDRHMKGHRNGAMAPLGYDLVDGKLVINPAQAEVVKRIFELYIRDHGILMIAKRFNSEGVPYKEKWNYSTVHYVLTNPVYLGKLRWNYRKGGGELTGKEIIVDSTHEAIISEELWEYAQKVKDRRKRDGIKASSTYAFTGVLRCARCGYAMIGFSRPVKDGRKRYYKCIGRFNYGICNMPFIAESSVNRTFLEVLEWPQDKIDRLTKQDKPQETKDEVFEQLKRELGEIDRQKKRLQEGYLAGIFSQEDVSTRIKEYLQKEEYIKGQLQAAPTKEKSHLTYEQIMQGLREISNIWETIEDEMAKKNFIHDIFEHITINTDVQDAKGGPGSFVPCYIAEWGVKA